MKKAKPKWKIAVLILLCWLVGWCVLLPLYHKSVPEDSVHLENLLPQDIGSSTERIQCIDDNTQALIWRIRVIESAQEELILTTFDFRDDESGRDIMSSLLAAADRGVKVRIVVDGIHGMLFLNRSPWFRTLCASPNVEAKFYNPVNLLTAWKLNFRMHDKYIVADDHAYLLGGRNTGNLFLGNYQQSQNIDRDLLVYSPEPDSGTSLTAVKQYFEEIWQLPDTKPFTKSIRPDSSARQEIEVHYQNLHQQYPEAFHPFSWEKETYPTNGIRLLTNPIEAENKAPLLWNYLITIMGQGSDVIIQTPYIICGQSMYQDLTELEQQGTQIQVILNAVENGANPWGCTDYLNQKKNLRATGMDIYEFIGAHSLHTKTVLIDDQISVVGSFNFDMRSAYLDTEMMLVVDSPELNAHLRKIAQDQMDQSLCIRPDGVLVSGQQYQPRPLGVVQTILYGILRIFLPLFRHLL